jgi:hypothetical protein
MPQKNPPGLEYTAQASTAEEAAATLAAQAYMARWRGVPASVRSKSPSLSAGTATPSPPNAAATQPWRATLPEQVRSVAQLLPASPTALPLAAIEAGFKGKGPWKKGLPRILETLEALLRARHVANGWRG